MSKIHGRVLIIAGSDSGGGAGIQADIKTVTALGAYAMTAVTALTAQDTTGVYGIVAIEPAFIARQIELALGDIGADCIKIGMLHDESVIDAVADILERKGRGVPVVLDPVMVAKGGQALLEADAIATLKRRLLPLAMLVTPNLPEAERLSGRAITSRAELIEAASGILTFGCAGVLLKGGHLAGDPILDVLATADHFELLESQRIDTPHTHGTGCTLASAIATGIAQGFGPLPAVERARAYVQEAIRTAPGLGRGHGPLNHCHTVRPFPGG